MCNKPLKLALYIDTDLNGCKSNRFFFFFFWDENSKVQESITESIFRSYQKLQLRLCYWQQNGKMEDYRSAGLLGSLGRFAAAQKGALPLSESCCCDTDILQLFLSREENNSYSSLSKVNFQYTLHCSIEKIWNGNISPRQMPQPHKCIPLVYTEIKQLTLMSWLFSQQSKSVI